MPIGICLLVFAVLRLAAIYRRGREPYGGIRLEVEDTPIRVGIVWYRGRIRKVSAAIDVGADLSFSMYREGWFDRIAKFLGIARELQTGDVQFDGRIYVQCEDSALHAALMSNRALRNALFDLMSARTTTEISAANGRLWIVSDGYNEMRRRDDGEIASKVIDDFLPAFRAARTELDKIRGAGTGEERDPTRSVRRRITTAIVVCVICGALGLLYSWPHLDHQVVRVAIPTLASALTFVVLAAFIAPLWLVLGATAFTHRVMLDILAAAVPGAWFAMYGFALFYNQALDSGSARQLAMPVVQAYQSQSRKNHHWYLQSESWPDPRVERTVRISRDEYALILTRHCVDVLWREGRLGDGWVEQYLESAEPTCAEGVEK